MSKAWTLKELVYDLVAHQSDTFTTQETDLAKHIYGLIKEQDYWKEHPELCGLYNGNDVIGRLIPWALRRGTTSKTVILSGHFDCVEIDSYGILKPFALNPDKLKEEMKKRKFSPDVMKDLNDDNWLFGRGVADMKGGEACIIYELFKYAEQNLSPETNLLFVGVHDEEHQAEGIMQSVSLMCDLKKKYGLDYRILLNPEPGARNNPNDFFYRDGSIGKILPGIVVKSKLSHVGQIMHGFNGLRIAANIVNRLDLNPDFISEEFGIKTTPPSVLYMKDTKNEYNVSLPNYTEIYTHIPLTKNLTVPDACLKLKDICQKAADETVEQYNEAYRAYIGDSEIPAFDIKVMTYSELEEYCRGMYPDFEEKKAELMKRKIEEVNSGKKLIQVGGGFEIIEEMLEWSKIVDPVIVIGLLPPYVPAVNNHYNEGFDREGTIKVVSTMLKERFGLGFEIEPYSMGMSDNSYISCTDIEADIEGMKNLVTPKELYNLPFEKIAEITMPSVMIGPWGKDFHAMTERVYLPDIEEVVPAVIETMIENA